MPPDGKETLEWVPGHKEPVLPHSHGISECDTGMDVPVNSVSVATLYLPSLPWSARLIFL